MALSAKDIKRFWSKINRDGPIPEHRPELGPCWQWTAGLTCGYGSFWAQGKTRRANRVAYELVYGLIPDELCVLHHCDNSRCCNPNHLWIGTDRDNVQDCIQKGRFPQSPFAKRANAQNRTYKKQLTDIEITEIRRQWQAMSSSPREMARVFGTTQSHILYIVRSEN